MVCSCIISHVHRVYNIIHIYCIYTIIKYTQFCKKQVREELDTRIYGMHNAHRHNGSKIMVFFNCVNKISELEYTKCQKNTLSLDHETKMLS